MSRPCGGRGLSHSTRAVPDYTSGLRTQGGVGTIGDRAGADWDPHTPHGVSTHPQGDPQLYCSRNRRNEYPGEGLQDTTSPAVPCRVGGARGKVLVSMGWGRGVGGPTSRRNHTPTD